MLCSSVRQFDNPAILSVFGKATNQRVLNTNVSIARTETISLNNTNQCISNPPVVCYKVAYYETTISLPASAGGYIISYQVNFRVDNMNNLQPGYNRVGASFAAEIPGSSSLEKAYENNRAKFGDNDLSIVCASNAFSYRFTATDADGDELRYYMCEAYQGGGRSDFGNEQVPPDPPPYGAVPYGPGYSGSMPLGAKVDIDPQTGMISGTAPSSGTYVIAVCVAEYRNHVLIATQRKDFQVTIAPCTLTSAELPSAYMLCSDSKTISLANNSISPMVHSYYWEIAAGNGVPLFTSTEPLPSYTFTDTGTYQVKLVINRDEKCIDSASAFAKVYPGFVPGFNFSGICLNKPTGFTDVSTSVYGVVNHWNWFFDDGIAGDSIANPSHTYTAEGTKDVQLIVANSVGCIDTINRPVTVMEKPPVGLAFRDTLICLDDTLRLMANGSGNFTWSPVQGMQNSNSATPVVSPKTSTLYYVELNDQDCTNKDSVMVNVVDHVNLDIMKDTIVCSNDAVPLQIQSNGLLYTWSPSEQVNDAHLQTPVSYTNDITTYYVTATIGHCIAQAEVTVKAVPYPTAYAGNDTIICYNTAVQLRAVTNGNAVTWASAATLSNASSITPFASPVASETMYILYAYDNRGCPKPGMDTMIVRMLPRIQPFAGRDTTVVINQPLQLEASGGTSYSWTPATGLSDAAIANPVALYTTPFESLGYKVMVYNEAGCKDSAYLNVTVFKILPTVFVPGAFTPNGDGRNDLLRPVAAGMKQVEYFKVFNRWGQLLYNAGISNRGWDGTVNGLPQQPGTFVWIVKAIDYNGNSYVQKGTVVLMR